MSDYARSINWFVVHTKPCREEMAARNIGRLGVEVFLPKIRHECVVKDVIETRTKPLFPCYLFARFCPLTFLHLIQYARGVRRVVSAGEAPLPVEEEVILTLRGRLTDTGHVRPEPRTLLAGTRVQVKEGPLRGLIGVLEQEMSDQERVMILLEAVHCQIRLMLERRALSTAVEVV
jgi:transcriptional antiterminator RfaH